MGRKANGGSSGREGESIRLSTEFENEFESFLTAWDLEPTWFALIRKSLENQTIELVDVHNPSQKADIPINSTSNASAIEWASVSSDAIIANQKNKKRRTSSASNRALANDKTSRSPLVCIGLCSGDIECVSPITKSTVCQLKGGHKLKISSLSFNRQSNQLFSSSGDGIITKWNIDSGAIEQVIDVKEPVFGPMQTLSESLIISNQNVLVFNINQNGNVESDSSTNVSNHSSIVTSISAKDSDKVLSILSVGKDDNNVTINTVATLRTEVNIQRYKNLLSKDSVLRVQLSNHNHAVVLNSVGELEVFESVLADDNILDGNVIKSKRVNSKSKFSVLLRSDLSSKQLQILNFRINGNTLLISFLEDGVLKFASVDIVDDNGLKSYPERKCVLQRDSEETSLTSERKKNAQVSTGGVKYGLQLKPSSLHFFKHEEANGSIEPTLAEQLQQLHFKETESMLQKSKTNDDNIIFKSSASMSTVLMQSLRNNDIPLLESCLHVEKEKSIIDTLERTDPTLIPLLLENIARKLAKKPKRMPSLALWIKWTIIIHATTLRSVSGFQEQLRSIYNVLNLRSSNLDKLLSLKGRLDLIASQIELKSRNQRGEDEDLSSDSIPEYNESADESDNENHQLPYEEQNYEIENATQTFKTRNKNRTELENLNGDSSNLLDKDDDMESHESLSDSELNENSDSDISNVDYQQ